MRKRGTCQLMPLPEVDRKIFAHGAVQCLSGFNAGSSEEIVHDVVDKNCRDLI